MRHHREFFAHAERRAAWQPSDIALARHFGNTRLVEVVTNDDLDGVVTAPVNAQVLAYGQAFFPSHGRFAAGIHDVHCSTHRGADHGWVVVNGQQHPASCQQHLGM